MKAGELTRIYKYRGIASGWRLCGGPRCEAWRVGSYSGECLRSDAGGDIERVCAGSDVRLQAEAGATDCFVKGNLGDLQLRVGAGHFRGSAESQIFRPKFRGIADVPFRERALDGRERLLSRKPTSGTPDGDDFRNQKGGRRQATAL